MQAVYSAVVVLLCFAGVVTVTNAMQDVPPWNEYAKTARFIVHKAVWCSLTTISANMTMKGQPFTVPTSVSDGPVKNGTGVPYFYHATIGTVYIDVLQNNKVTLSFSEAQFGMDECITTTSTDPEWPLCARLSLIGQMQILSDPNEIATAKEAVFSRHPAMLKWEGQHSFVFMKFDISRILLVDFFGGWKEVSVKDYFNAQGK